MAQWQTVGNGHLEGSSILPDLDPSKLKITLSESLKPIPAPETLVFGQTMSDHMLVTSFDPATGWSAPEIKPYGPFSLDPCSSCFQYATNVFEGMKAYIGPDGTPRLFRPDKNMARLERSAERVALPPFNSDALLTLIKKLVLVDRRWIPTLQGHSLYVRPTIIGTRAALGVSASDHALLYVILSPAGPFFRTGPKPISLLAVSENVRAWPGGTGCHKIAGNYTPGFLPQRVAAKQGHDQILWLLGEDAKVTEAGAMNFFVVLKHEGEDVELVTPPLDGTILPGVTRDSVISLAKAHTEGKVTLPNIPPSQRLHVAEKSFTMADLSAWHADGKLLEAFGVGTAAIVSPVGRIGFGGKTIQIPAYEGGMGPIGKALWERIVDIQEGKFAWENWSVPCE